MSKDVLVYAFFLKSIDHLFTFMLQCENRALIS